MQTSARGIDLIKQFEGLELEAYQDIAGIWTIGYGHTGPDVQPGMKISEREAEALLRRDLTPRERAVDRLTGPSLNQNEFDALVSFVYNVGENAYRNSTARKRLNRGDRVGAAEALTWWNKATVSGVLREVAGLTRRRAAERALFLTPVNPPIVNAQTPLNDNSRVTPIEDTPRRDSIAGSRTVQGATVAGGAGVAASTMGRDTAEELDQIETNIEQGESLIEDKSSEEGSTPPRSQVNDPITEDPDTIDDGEIDGADDPDAEIPDASTDDDTETDDDTDTAEAVDCIPRPDGDGADGDELEAIADDSLAESGDAADAAIEDAEDAEAPIFCDVIDEDGTITADVSEATDDRPEIVDSIEIDTGPARPSKHEVHAVEAQVQLALLVLIVLSVLYIIFARIDDWLNFRR